MSIASLPQQLSTRFKRRFADLVGRNVLVALSGGADSVALLHLLREPGLGLHLEAAHVHHGARGSAADADAAFCDEMCRRLDVPFHLLSLEPLATPEGREAAWRRARYSKLHALATQLEADAIATAHHRDDVAEGVLVQLLRGTGPRGLAGIASRTTTGIIRPLLDWCHDELVAWLRAQRIPWREDASNQSTEHLRNLVRIRVLPELELLAPGLRGHLVSLAQALAEDERHLQAELETRAHWIDPWHPQGGVPLGEIRALSPSLRSRWLHAQAERTGIGKISRRQIELLGGLLETSQPRAIGLAGRWSLFRARNRLWLEPPGHVMRTSYRTCIDPATPRVFPVPTWSLVARAADAPESGEGGPWRWAPPVGARITMRSGHEGEHAHARTDQTDVIRVTIGRLPRHLRRAWPRFWVGDKIEWIPGLWQDQPAGNRSNLVLEVVRQ